jgi:hypothetical protein
MLLSNFFGVAIGDLRSVLHSSSLIDEAFVVFRFRRLACLENRARIADTVRKKPVFDWRFGDSGEETFIFLSQR